MKNVSMVVAFCHKSFGIGASGTIPWNIPEDRARFKNLTMGKTVVMGRRTFESLGSQPLVGRFNVVLTSVEKDCDSDMNLCYTKNCIMSDAFSGDAVYVIGGTRLYRQYMGKAERIYATVVEKEFAGLDTFFPTSGFGAYRIEVAGPRTWSESEQCFYRFITYRLRSARGAGEEVFIDLETDILSHGSARPDRTGVGTLSLFGRQLRFDISESIPVITTRALGIKTVIRELLWFLRGSCDSKELERDGVRIWAGNTSRAFLDARGLTSYAEGETGPLYGHALRRFGAPYCFKGAGGAVAAVGCCFGTKDVNNRQAVEPFDQLEALIAGIKADPFSRRHLMTTFNPGVVDQCVLAPCHGIAIQFYVDEIADDGEEKITRGLSCHVYCRSSDTFLGLPFNIASYAILVYLVAARCSVGTAVCYVPNELFISTGDAHVYANHVTQAWTQIGREPLPPPKLVVSEAAAEKDWANLTVDDFEIIGYLSHPAIVAEMAV